MRAIHQQHDADVNPTETRAVSEAPSPWLAVRVILSVGAAVLLLTGSFLEWAQGTDGSALAVQGYWETDAGTAGFFSSAGLVTAICGAAIILGLAFKSGWLTRFAGAVALVAFTLVVIQLGREGSLDSLLGGGHGPVAGARRRRHGADRRLLPHHAHGIRCDNCRGHRPRRHDSLTRHVDIERTRSFESGP